MQFRTHRMTTPLGLAVGVVLTFTATASAQEGTMTWGEMFLMPGDIIGRLVTWGLIIMSIAVVALLLKHWTANRASNIMPGSTVREVEELLNEKKFREAIELSSQDESVFARVIHDGLSQASAGYAAMIRGMEETADELSAARVRRLESLNVLGAVGPMIGLFGTVYGMIVAFWEIANTATGSPNPSDLAAGISTALVTTFWGLIVGIPAVAAYAMLRNRIDSVTAEATGRASEMIDQFRPGAKKSDKSDKGDKLGKSDKSEKGNTLGGGLGDDPATPKPKPSE